MPSNRVLAASVCVLAFLMGSVVTGIVFVYLPYHGSRLTLALTTMVISVTVAFLAFHVVSRLPQRRSIKVAIVTALVAAFALPLLSMFVHGKVTYARFGFTVYGLVPVPALDITINQHGVLWFRPKSHLATISEVTPLLSDDVDVLVIGTGWHGIMDVEEAISDLKGVDVRILKTPQAFELFNQLKSRGRKVVLLAHSTC